jgi:hypothetical protein
MRSFWNSEYDSGGGHSFIIIVDGQEGSGWGQCISQLRRMVKHAKQISNVGAKNGSIQGQLRTVEQGRWTFAAVVVGKGLVKEREDSSKGIIGKNDKRPFKVMDSFVKEAKFVLGDCVAQVKSCVCRFSFSLHHVTLKKKGEYCLISVMTLPYYYISLNTRVIQ